MASQGQGGEAALGLVRSSTSYTVVPAGWVPIDTGALRLKQMKKSVLNSARLIRDSMPGRWRMAMVTLTYARCGEWEPKHVSDFLKRVRSYLSRRGVSARYVWVAELQERGAVHYHVLVFLPLGLTLPKPDRRGWWPHGSTRVEWAKKAIGYLVKYVSKLSSTEIAFPRGLRICGSGGLDRASRRERAWWRLPVYVRAVWDVPADVVRAVGGGFLSRVSGEWMAARYKFAGCRLGRPWIVDLWATA